jgi:hypothetical protein
MRRKWLAVGLILLFIGTAIIPCINANISNQSIQERLPPATTKTLKVIRYEYKSDGSIEKKVLEVAQNEFHTFQDEFHFAKTTEEKLSLYKKYDLIPQNVSMASLRKNFHDDVERVYQSSMSIINYKQNTLKKIHLKNFSPRGFMVNTNSDVYGEDGFTLRLSLGLSPLVGRFNFLLLLLSPGWKAQSKDFVLCRVSGYGDILTNGTLGEIFCAGQPFFLSMMGFVGYILLCPFFLTFYEFFIGFAKVTVALAI